MNPLKCVVFREECMLVVVCTDELGVLIAKADEIDRINKIERLSLCNTACSDYECKYIHIRDVCRTGGKYKNIKTHNIIQYQRVNLVVELYGKFPIHINNIFLFTDVELDYKWILDQAFKYDRYVLTPYAKKNLELDKEKLICKLSSDFMKKVNDFITTISSITGTIKHNILIIDSVQLYKKQSIGELEISI